MLRAARVAAALALLLAVAGATAAAAVGQRDPRRETERLTAADNALARRVALRAADLTPAWKQTALPSDQGEGLRCPGFNPDFSRFTITGKASTGFTTAAGSTVVSLVEVYVNRADAVGDFRLGTQPQVSRCLRTTLERSVPPSPGLTFRVRSSKLQPLRVGDRGAVFRLVAEVSSGRQSLPVYLDVLVFQRGRTIAALLYTSPLQRVSGQLTLARAVARRMR
jgi:hypothetical protein